MPPDKRYFVDDTHKSRIRVELWKGQGQIEAFRIQLEYNHNPRGDLFKNEDSDWRAVARFDHTPNSPSGHDVRKEGLHLDICGGEEPRRKKGFPKVRLSHAPGYCVEWFKRQRDALLEAYEERASVPHWVKSKY